MTDVIAKLYVRNGASLEEVGTAEVLQAHFMDEDEIQKTLTEELDVVMEELFLNLEHEADEMPEGGVAPSDLPDDAYEGKPDEEKLEARAKEGFRKDSLPKDEREPPGGWLHPKKASELSEKDKADNARPMTTTEGGSKGASKQPEAAPGDRHAVNPNKGANVVSGMDSNEQPKNPSPAEPKGASKK